MNHNQIERCADIEALRAECLRLRQGLWDCYRIAGGDTDGDDTPSALISSVTRVAKECVEDLARQYQCLLVGSGK